MSVRADINLDSMLKLNNWKSEKGRAMRKLAKKRSGDGFTPNIWLTVAGIIRDHIKRNVR